MPYKLIIINRPKAISCAYRGEYQSQVGWDNILSTLPTEKDPEGFSLGGSVRDSEGENDSVLTPASYPSVEVSEENELTQSPWNRGDTSLLSVRPVIDEPSSSDTGCNASIPQQLNEINRNLSLPGLPPAGGDGGCRKDSDTCLDASVELRTQPIDRPYSDGATGRTDAPSMNLPLQLISSPRKEESGEPRNEHRSQVGPESTLKPLSVKNDIGTPRDKAHPNTCITRTKKKSTVEGKDVGNALPPKGTGTVHKTKKPTLQGPGPIASTPVRIIQQSFAKYHLAHIPLNFYHGQPGFQPDLSQVPFDPYAVILGNPRWEERLILNDDDLINLLGRVKEITGRIPSKDNNELIQLLQGKIKPVEDYRSGSRDDIIIAMAHREHEKRTHHRFEKIIAEIRHFSLLQVLRYIHGQVKFTEIAKKHFKFKFRSVKKKALAGPAHSTPARPARAAANGVKSTGLPSAKSSPRYQNGDSIDLPEIPTDSEYEGSENVAIPDWVNSPALLIQETMDPVSVFGLPREIKLAEMFKSAEGPGALTAGLKRKHKADAVVSLLSPCPEPPTSLRKPLPDLDDPPRRGDNHYPRISVLSHKLPTPLPSAKSVKFEVTPIGATNDTLSAALGSKRKRPTGSTIQLVRETEAADTAKVVPRTGGLDISHQLCADVESLVNDLKVKNEYIMIKKRSPTVPAVTCYPDSILRLRPDGWFNDELIDAVPGLVETPDSSETHILSSYLYDYLEKENFT
ncbi:hypothetical protein BKA64DRAFT_643245 [Cadophora sp. MPI-SDFR-AT-0126]|nr:hypothetical protein BKA64DRAFT_643245 [Leotiomycetes sp. MPI-SDFR-AT-0126]